MKILIFLVVFAVSTSSAASTSKNKDHSSSAFIVKRSGSSASTASSSLVPAASGKSEATARGHGLGHYGGGYGWGHHDAGWLLSLIIITAPLVVLPYVAFLFLIYNSPFSERHYHHIHGHHHHRSLDVPYYGVDGLLTDRVLSSLDGFKE